MQSLELPKERNISSGQTSMGSSSVRSTDDTAGTKTSARLRGGSKGSRRSPSLPSLAESGVVLPFEAPLNSHDGPALTKIPRQILLRQLSDNSTTPTTRTASSSVSSGKENRLRQVRRLQEQAEEFTETGAEEKALGVYQLAIKVLGSEIARINVRIRKCQCKHEKTRNSILARFRTDLCRVSTKIGKLRTKMAIIYERLGDYDRAIACCREAEELHRQQPSCDTDEVASKACGKSSQSNDPTEKELLVLMSVMLERLRTAKKALEGRDELLAEIQSLRKRIGVSLTKEEKAALYEAVEEASRHLLRVEIEALGTNHPQVADTLQLVSTIKLEQGETQNAIEYLSKAIQIGVHTLGERHSRNGQYYLRLARILLSQGIDSMALAHFHKATNILQHSKRFERVLGSTFNDVGVIYMRRQEYGLAVDSLQSSLRNYEQAARASKSDSDPIMKSFSLSTDSLQVFRNLGECYMKQDMFDFALEAFTKVLELQRNARRVYDNSSGLDLSQLGSEKLLVDLIKDEGIARTLMHMGRASAAGGNHEDALLFLREAVQVLNSISLVDELNKGATRSMEQRKEQTANAMYCIAEESLAVGDYDAAIYAYGESTRLRNFDGRNREASVMHSVLCFVGIAKVHGEKGNHSEARRLCQETMRFCRSSGLPSDHALAAMVKKRLVEAQAELKESGEETKEEAPGDIGQEAYERALTTISGGMNSNSNPLRASTATIPTSNLTCRAMEDKPLVGCLKSS